MTEFFRIKKGSKKKNTVYITPTNGYLNDTDINRILVVDSKLADNSFSVGLGNKFYDIISFMDAGNFAISEKVKQLLETNEITGWDCFPIAIDRSHDGNYFAFQLNSRPSGKILNLEKLDNYEEDYLKFNLSYWDGCDFFTLENTAVLMCTLKVKNLFESAKITNIDFVPAIAVS